MKRMSIIDAHYHLVTELESEEHLISQMKKNSISKTALISSLSEPFHVGKIAGFLSSLMRKLLLGPGQKAGLIMYNTTVTPSGKFSVLGKTYRIYDDPGNDMVADMCKRYPDMFFFWILVNPRSGRAVEEVEKYMNHECAIGVKAHPFWHRYPVNQLDDVAALCEEKGLPMLIHLGGKKDTGDFKFLPKRHKKLKVIFAHGGVPFFKSLWEYIKHKDNLYIDLSSPYLDFNVRKLAVEKLGAHKCIYGSDGPFGYEDENGQYDHGAIVSEIENLPLKPVEKELIFSKNFENIIT